MTHFEIHSTCKQFVICQDEDGCMTTEEINNGETAMQLPTYIQASAALTDLEYFSESDVLFEIVEMQS